MNIYSKNQLSTDILADIANIHTESFPNQFLSRIGINGLISFYKMHDLNNEVICIASVDNFTIGFIQGGKENFVNKFRSKIIKENILRFIFIFFNLEGFKLIINHFNKIIFHESNKATIKIPENYYYLSVMALNSNYRGKKVSDKLFYIFEEKCIERGYNGYYLNVSKNNNRAIAFYLKQNMKVFIDSKQTITMIKSFI